MRKLEEKYERELVVIGVHSAKFKTEQDTDNIRKAILRHNLSHPVVNDAGFQIWRSFGVSAWPTLVLIDPEGQVIDTHAGEMTFAQYDPLIGQAVANYDQRGLIDSQPLKLKPELAQEPARLLSFPSKVLADPEHERLFVADTGHHRLLLIRLTGGDSGQIEAVVGSGNAGLADGSYGEAAFYEPRGMALHGQTLYVADTENHAIRAVDLQRQEVSTIAGTGEQSRVFGATGGPARSTALSSPWDLDIVDGGLFIAMAGTHQLWRLDLASGELLPFAGTGREALIDGSRRDAALNQPSGLASDGRRLFFADAEASAVRWADLNGQRQVGTTVGTGLFDFGDRDGVADRVLLQHPLGLAYQSEGALAGQLLVADTYNHKIKLIDPSARRASTFLGSGERGWQDGPASQAMFNEPAGVSLAGNVLYIADTDNHLIRSADLATNVVSTVEIEGPEELLLNQGQPVEEEALLLDERQVAPGPGRLQITLDPPPGFKLNLNEPFSFSWSSTDTSVISFAGRQSYIGSHPPLPFIIPVRFAIGQAEVILDLSIFYCPLEQERCYVDLPRLRLPIKVGDREEEISVAQIAYSVPA